MLTVLNDFGMACLFVLGLYWILSTAHASVRDGSRWVLALAYPLALLCLLVGATMGAAFGFPACLVALCIVGGAGPAAPSRPQH